MAPPVKLAVLGAGLIGKRHIKHVLDEPMAELVAIVDPSPVGEAIASEVGAKWFSTFAEMVAAARPDGVIIATPNQIHVRNGFEAVEARIPALIEKPIVDDIAAGERLVGMAEAKGVPLLTGHHRRHNPMMQKAKQIIESGKLGRILVVNAMFWLFKPEEYFDTSWRRERGAGPVFLNLIHDIDNLRYLLGDVTAVQALESNAVRGNAVEETAVILIEFKNGILGTASVSDSVVAPWSWEMTTGENPAYPKTEEACYMIGGTHGSLSVPSLNMWTNPGKRSWMEPFECHRAEIENEDPLVLQIRQLCRVIRGEEAPLVSGREGLETLKVIDAVKRSAAAGKRVSLT
ncbi:Gfo/Idh/MocA family oxidoreductase [Rhizobium lentis]|uniref:Gfo/Idh/MocA family protein n=1 Tax=Rhizobium lentis TaxID=1138194 RepID=UPI001C83EC52|nr:Gfo/Idh/MocA family oxidoreductase [Rhizobium lentis]MBX5133680.1 Gfo/Idh/MocA family oxidoreductase [Rhizobium lentis]MBX5139662.1 Gfo/Idh/MocA family oxidoreductase [Rhizobium lentis]MBX5177696.1 Gfo/Idh/MocA family oxidoreductase [Rhizobium lentis]